MKKVLITGNTSGIGAALHHLYTSKGWKVHGLSRSDGSYVNNWKTWETLMKQIASGTFDKCDAMILNAGIAFFKKGEEFKNAEYLVKVNLLGVYYGLISAFGLLNEGASICCVSSVSAVKPEPDEPLYSATKSGVSSLVRSFGMKYIKKYRVFGVELGFCGPTKLGGGGELPKELFDKIPIGREMTTEEMANYIYLLMTEFPYLLADTVPIHGGWRYVNHSEG